MGASQRLTMLLETMETTCHRIIHVGCYKASDIDRPIFCFYKIFHRVKALLEREQLQTVIGHRGKAARGQSRDKKC